MRSTLGDKTPSFDFDKVLTTVNRIFEQWRYSYEGNMDSSYGLQELTKALRESIVKQQQQHDYTPPESSPPKS